MWQTKPTPVRFSVSYRFVCAVSIHILFIRTRLHKQTQTDCVWKRCLL